MGCICTCFPFKKVTEASASEPQNYRASKITGYWEKAVVEFHLLRILGDTHIPMP